MQLPMRSCGIVIITVKVPANLVRHRRQCPSSGRSLTEALGTHTCITHIYLEVDMVIQIVTDCKEVMTNNEHAIWAAYFSPSIFVRQCVLSPSFVASQRRQVHSCACRAPADHCAICVIQPTFSQICPCLLLAGAQVTLGGAHYICPQYRHAMSNAPFHRLIWFCT